MASGLNKLVRRGVLWVLEGPESSRTRHLVTLAGVTLFAGSMVLFVTPLVFSPIPGRCAIAAVLVIALTLLWRISRDAERGHYRRLLNEWYSGACFRCGTLATSDDPALCPKCKTDIGCPECGYSLRNNKTGVCSECGLDIPKMVGRIRRSLHSDC